MRCAFEGCQNDGPWREIEATLDGEHHTNIKISICEAHWSFLNNDADRYSYRPGDPSGAALIPSDIEEAMLRMWASPHPISRFIAKQGGTATD